MRFARMQTPCATTCETAAGIRVSTDMLLPSRHRRRNASACKSKLQQLSVWAVYGGNTCASRHKLVSCTGLGALARPLLQVPCFTSATCPSTPHTCKSSVNDQQLQTALLLLHTMPCPFLDASP